MIPEQFPVFVVGDIFIDKENYESDNGSKTTVGWLRSLFLWQEDGSSASAQDYKDYYSAVETFKKINKIPKSTNLGFWEDGVTKKKQVEFLNRLRVAL